MHIHFFFQPKTQPASLIYFMSGHLSVSNEKKVSDTTSTDNFVINFLLEIKQTSESRGNAFFAWTFFPEDEKRGPAILIFLELFFCPGIQNLKVCSKNLRLVSLCFFLLHSKSDCRELYSNQNKKQKADNYKTKNTQHAAWRQKMKWKTNIQTRWFTGKMCIIKKSEQVSRINPLMASCLVK